MWLIELVWGVLLLDTDESLWQSTGRRERGGLAVLKVMEEQGGSPHLGKGDANQVSLLTDTQRASVA